MSEPLGIVDSIAQAAAKLKKPVPVLRAMKKLGCPAFLKGSRVDLDLLTKVWADWEAKVDDMPVSPDAENKRLKNEKLRIEIGKLKDQFIDKAELAGHLAALCAEVDATLRQKLITEWPGNAQGMPADEMRQYGTELHGSIVKKFKEFALQWTP